MQGSAVPAGSHAKSPGHEVTEAHAAAGFSHEDTKNTKVCYGADARAQAPPKKLCVGLRFVTFVFFVVLSRRQLALGVCCRNRSFASGERALSFCSQSHN